MKKVLFIEAAYLKGGIETFILNVAKNIDQKKFELYLLKECEIASIESDFLALGGKIIRITSFSENKIRYLKDLKNIIKKYIPDGQKAKAIVMERSDGEDWNSFRRRFAACRI